MIVKVAVIEKDPRFLDRLTTVFSKNYSDKLEIYPFSDSEVALSTLQFVKPHILIADESIRIPRSSLPADCALAYFVSDVSTDRVDGHRAICKFQRAELIYKQLVGILSDSADSTSLSRDAETKFVTFTSPVGGVGVSSTAAAFALRLASQGHNVLYLDLDPYGCPDLYFHGEGNYTFGDVLHTLIHKDGNLTELLGHATRKDPRGVSYFCEAPSTVIYPTMDTEAISRLLRELRIIAAFDYIVVDIPFDRFLMQEDLRDRATGTVLVTDATEGSQLKLARGYAALCQQVSAQDASAGSEVFLLTNRCNSFPMRLAELSSLQELGQIPFLPQSDTAGQLSSMASLPVFDALI